MVAIISVLAGIVIIAINPSKQLGNTNNATRRADVNTIINAIYQYSLDNNGNFPSGVDSTAGTVQVLGTAASGCDTTCSAQTSVAACLDLSGTLVPDYVVDIPYDLKSGTTSNTDYYVNKLANGRLEVGSCDPEQSATIKVTR